MFKKKFSLLIILLFVFFNSFSQSELTETQKLFSLAKVWGFLKYYHPTASNKNMDWDKELFVKIKQLDTVNSVNSLNNLYLNWINALGKVPKKKKETPSFDNPYFKNASFSWVDSLSYFSLELKANIKFIKENKRDYKNKYALGIYLTDLPNFENELVYKEVDYLSRDYKLLTLFRFWNIIEYFCPNTYLFDKKWDAVLYEMIPKFIKVKDVDDYAKTKQKIVTSLDDSHSNYYSPTFHKNNKYYTPFHVKLLKIKLLLHTYIMIHFVK